MATKPKGEESWYPTILAAAAVPVKAGERPRTHLDLFWSVARSEGMPAGLTPAVVWRALTLAGWTVEDHTGNVRGPAGASPATAG